MWTRTLCALALLTAGCASWPPAGHEASLEAEIELLQAELNVVASEALGPHTVIGTRVLTQPCEFGDSYWATVAVSTRPDGSTVLEAREAARAWLARRGIPVELDDPDSVSRPLMFKLPPKDIQTALYFSTGRVPGVELIMSGFCYARDKVDAADPYSLSRRTGTELVYGP